MYKRQLEALRDQVAVVLQKNVLFSGSIRENLRWGNKDATDAETVSYTHLDVYKRQVYNIIVARTFMQNTIPEELYEAASMDGCGDIRVFFKICLLYTSRCV